MGTAELHDPGGKVRTKIADGMVGWAEFSDCGRYRQLLGRYWGDTPYDFSFEPYALWIGMNPSTATADVNDPTISREINFTKRLGLNCMVKVNVMDYRATNPKDLMCVMPEVCSGNNLPTIGPLAESAEKVIAAWGSLPGPLAWTAQEVEYCLSDAPLWCLGKTKNGSPRHPLYVRGDAPLELYREARVPTLVPPIG